MKSLIFIFSLLMLGAQSAYAVYGVDDGTDDADAKNESVNAEVEVREFLLLDSVSDMELSYSSGGTVEGAGGSVYTGSGTVTFNTNIAATVTLTDATLTHVDGGQTTRNTIAAEISFSDGTDTKTFNPRSKSTRLNSSHITISYAVFCLKKKNTSSPCNKKQNQYTYVNDHSNYKEIN